MSRSGHDDDLLPGCAWPADSEPTDRADRILSGTPAPDDLAAGGDRVDGLVSSMRSGMAESDCDAERVAQITEKIRAGAAEPAIASRVSLLRRTSVRSAMAIASVPLLVGTAAAAATGSLPGPLQEVAHSAFASLGVPGPSGGGGRSNREAVGKSRPVGRTTTPAAHGPSAPSTTVFNACNAWLVNGPAPSARAVTLIAQAATSASVSAAGYCALPHPGGSDAPIVLGGASQVAAPAVPNDAGTGGSQETAPQTVSAPASPPPTTGGGTSGATGNGGGHGHGKGNAGGNGDGEGNGGGHGKGNAGGNANGHGKSASAPGHAG